MWRTIAADIESTELEMKLNSFGITPDEISQGKIIVSQIRLAGGYVYYNILRYEEEK